MNEVPVQLDDLISYVDGRSADDNALASLLCAADVSQHLREIANQLIATYVSRARQSDASWTAIATELSMPPDAVRSRFPASTSDLFHGGLHEDEIGNVFQMLTEIASRSLTQAAEEAATMGHDHIETEDVLLGLMRLNDGVAANALRSVGLTLTIVRQQVETTSGAPSRAAPEHVPLSKRTKLALELSSAIARRLGDDYIGTDHILLGLLWERQGLAARILIDRHIDDQLLDAINFAKLSVSPTDRRRATTPRDHRTPEA